MLEWMALLRLLHLGATVYMAAPLYMLLVVNERARFGGPLAYTPYNVATHLAGPDQGGLRFDYRRPKHPYSDRFMLAGGHCIPTCYALWMLMGQALARKYDATGTQYTSTQNSDPGPIPSFGSITCWTGRM